MRLDEIEIGKDYYLRYQGRVRVVDIRPEQQARRYGSYSPGRTVRKAILQNVNEDGKTYGQEFTPRSSTRIECTWEAYEARQVQEKAARERMDAAEQKARDSLHRLLEALAANDVTASLRMEYARVKVDLGPEDADRLTALLQQAKD